MSYANPIWLEGRRKYWTRPDAYRFAPPGSPEAKMPGWIDPWATRVRAKEAAEDEARARAAAAQEELERELLQLRWEVKKLKLEHALWCFEQKYSANQPRVPAGSRESGRWIGAFTVPSQQPSQDATASRGPRLAQPGFGILIAEIPVLGGRRCVYNFGSYSVVVPGAANFRCSSRVHWSGGDPRPDAQRQLSCRGGMFDGPI